MAGNVVHLELPSKDGARARKFYGSLFGWKFKDAGMPGLDYFMTEGTQPVTAVFTSPDQKGAVIYFDVDDIDVAIKKVRQLGGQAEEKAPVPGEGWFAGCKDTEGTAFSLWQADKTAPMPERQAAGAAHS